MRVTSVGRVIALEYPLQAELEHAEVQDLHVLTFCDSVALCSSSRVGRF